MSKNCGYCGKIFIPDKLESVYCSKSCREEHNHQSNIYRILHPKKIKKSQTKYTQSEKGKEAIRRAAKKYKKRYLSKPENRLCHILRVRLNHSLKGCKKSKSVIKLINCSIQELKHHLERQFKEGMAWDNYGKNG